MPFIGPYWKNFATLFGVFCFLFQELEVFWSGTSYELGLEQGVLGEGVFWSLTYFNSVFENLVDFDEGPPPQLVNRSRVEIEGIEAALYWEVNKQLSLQAQATHARSNIIGTTEVLRNRPEWRASVSGLWRPSSGWRASTHVLYVGDTFDSSVPTGDSVLDSYVRVDVSMAWMYSEKISTSFAIINLFDEEYYEFVGFPAPGMQLKIGVRTEI